MRRIPGYVTSHAPDMQVYQDAIFVHRFTPGSVVMQNTTIHPPITCAAHSLTQPCAIRVVTDGAFGVGHPLSLHIQVLSLALCGG